MSVHHELIAVSPAEPYVEGSDSGMNYYVTELNRVEDLGVSGALLSPRVTHTTFNEGPIRDDHPLVLDGTVTAGTRAVIDGHRAKTAQERAANTARRLQLMRRASGLLIVNSTENGVLTSEQQTDLAAAAVREIPTFLTHGMPDDRREGRRDPALRPHDQALRGGVEIQALRDLGLLYAEEPEEYRAESPTRTARWVAGVMGERRAKRQAEERLAEVMEELMADAMIGQAPYGHGIIE